MKYKQVIAFLLIISSLFSGCNQPVTGNVIIESDNESSVTSYLTEETPSAGYYNSKPEFNFSIFTQYPRSENYINLVRQEGFGIIGYQGNEDVVFIDTATVHQKMPPVDYQEYRFKLLDSNEIRVIWIPVKSDIDLPVEINHEYKLEISVYEGRGLYYWMEISENNTMVFSGISGVSLSLVPRKYHQNKWFEAKESKIIWDHFTSLPCSPKVINTEVTFILGNGDSLTIHQGQSGILGDYMVYLPVARMNYEAGTCTETGFHGISFTLTRIQTPLTKK